MFGYSGIQVFRTGNVKGRPDFVDLEHLNTRTPGHLTRGFTLIELLVVLIGLIIVAAAVVPALRSAGHQEDLAEVASRVVASARYARNEAMERQATIVLTVESSPAEVRLAVDETGALSNQAPVGMGTPERMGASSSNMALNSTYALIRLPARIQAHLEAVPEPLNDSSTAMPANGANLETLRFPPDGRTTGGAVVLTDARGRTARVTVAPDTGVVRAEAGER